jgi:undecaprenol kinase/diacylglycerol kinase (ATP)
MKKKEKFSIRRRISSFGYALNGLKILISEEHNSRIHLIAALIAISLGFILHISKMEWIAIILVIGFVITSEIINSAIENLSDYLASEKNEIIKKTKDMAAAAVLVSAITSLVTGIIVFLPKLIVYAG